MGDTLGFPLGLLCVEEADQEGAAEVLAQALGTPDPAGGHFPGVSTSADRRCSKLLALSSHWHARTFAGLRHARRPRV